MDLHELRSAPAAPAARGSDEAAAPGDREPSARRGGGTLARRLGAVAVGVALLGAASLGVAALAFHQGGGRWFVVTSSSMGEAAPVGTLVLTEPTRASGPDADLRPGDVVSFRPPAVPGEVYTHRVASVGPEGVRTSGDTTGAVDPWLLADDDLVGRATALLPGLGWLVRALPWLAAGAAVVWLVGTRLPAGSTRSAFRLVAGCAVVLGVVSALRPFVGVVLLSTTVDAAGRGVAHVVSTGLAPVRVQAPDGGHADLVSGAVGHVPVPAGADVVALTTSLHLPLVGWLVVALLCASPLIGVLTVGLPAGPPRPAHGRRRAASTASASAVPASTAGPGEAR